MRRVLLVALASLAACGPDSATGACKDNLIAGDLVVTEVFADYTAPAGSSGTDDGKEWIEVYNNADRPISLKGVTVTASEQDGTKPSSHTMDDVTLAPGQYFTMGNATQDLVPAYVDYGYAGDLGDLANTGGGKISLKCGDKMIDEALYDNVKSGHSRELTSAAAPDYTLNDDPNSWCQGDVTEFETGNFGTPGQESDCTPVVMGACNDGGTMRPVVAPMPGQLVISEIMASPNGTDSDTEWIEVHALGNFDLNGIGIGRVADTTPEVLGGPDCIPVTSGTDIVFAHSTDMAVNGGLPAGKILATFQTALTGSSSSGGDIQLTLGGAVIDAVVYPKSTSGKSSQLDKDALTATANDDFSNFCDGTGSYGAGGLGSPGAANGDCATVAPAGKCMGTSGLRDIVPPLPGKLVITELMINPKDESTAGAQEWIEITNTDTTNAFDINGLGIDQAATTRVPDVITSSDCKSVAAGGHALFLHTTDSTKNGGINAYDATYGFTLSNSGGDVQILNGATVLDAVSWGNVTATMYDSKSLQLDPDYYDATMNDMLIGTGTKWCLGATTYGDLTNSGTPGGDNAQCAGVP